MKHIGILGASRGLGAALVEIIRKESVDTRIFLMSRSLEESADFTRAEDWESILERLSTAELDTIFYVAGGGPHGDYASKNWKDHQWAYRLNFEFPARLLHYFLQNSGSLKKLIFVGSSIAEDQPDPGAASYCAAKHALLGLVKSVQLEKPHLDVRLYSPGYMDTDMLPANAWPRQQGLAKSPNDVARRLWQWSESAVECGHFQEARDVGRKS